jgi:uncharacterized protein YheU (UPF0270 family)
MQLATSTDIRDLATLVAEIIRRMGADYGSSEDWRRDITTAVRIMERNVQETCVFMNGEQGAIVNKEPQ